jgi:hypothetical protein
LHKNSVRDLTSFIVPKDEFSNGKVDIIKELMGLNVTN